MMMLVCRANLADDELISTWNSWMLSRLGMRARDPPPYNCVRQGGAVKDDVMRADARAEDAQVAPLSKVMPGTVFIRFMTLRPLIGNCSMRVRSSVWLDGRGVGREHRRHVLHADQRLGTRRVQRDIDVEDCCVCTSYVASNFFIPADSAAIL